LTVFFIAFLAVFLAEMGDKTQLVTLTLSSRFSPGRVLAGALTALAVITALAVVLGDYLAALLPERTTIGASGLFFFAAGIWILFKKESPAQMVEQSGRGITVQTFLMVFLAELGDKTQLATIALTAAYGAPLAVFLGAMTGQLVNHGVAAYLGSHFLSRVPTGTLRLASGFLFIFFGALFLVTLF
jgi:putative Ca2+/H+ antiporter (TMEM165/GDT1 family)